MFFSCSIEIIILIGPKMSRFLFSCSLASPSFLFLSFLLLFFCHVVSSQLSCVGCTGCDLGSRVLIPAGGSFDLYAQTCPLGKHPAWSSINIKDVNQGNTNASTFSVRMYDYYNNSFGMGLTYNTPVSCVNITNADMAINTIRSSVKITCARTTGVCELTYAYSTRCVFDDCYLCMAYKNTFSLTDKFAWCPALDSRSQTFCAYNSTTAPPCANPITDCSMAPPYYPVDSSTAANGGNSNGTSTSSSSTGSSSSSGQICTPSLIYIILAIILSIII